MNDLRAVYYFDCCHEGLVGAIYALLDKFIPAISDGPPAPAQHLGNVALR